MTLPIDRARFSACVEMLFRDETEDVADRIRMAADAGLGAVEFWHWSNKDLASIDRALRDTGLPLTAMVAEPMIAITDPVNHPAFLAGVRASIEQARRLDVPVLIVQSGDVVAGRSRAAQRASVIEGLRRAAELVDDSGVRLALEPLNTRVDHAGYFLDSTAEGLSMLDGIGSPAVTLLYDIYHAAVMGETLEPVEGRIDRIAHVHLADCPGRHQPGSGTLDWRERLATLAGGGYRGYVGLEYRPLGPTLQSLSFLAAD
jgi:hydroxypyruvate isomerase